MDMNKWRSTIEAEREPALVVDYGDGQLYCYVELVGGAEPTRLDVSFSLALQENGASYGQQLKDALYDLALKARKTRYSPI